MKEITILDKKNQLVMKSQFSDQDFHFEEYPQLGLIEIKFKKRIEISSVPLDQILNKDPWTVKIKDLTIDAERVLSDCHLYDYETHNSKETSIELSDAVILSNLNAKKIRDLKLELDKTNSSLSDYLYPSRRHY